MRKGKGELTYHQREQLQKVEHRELVRLRREYEALERAYKSLAERAEAIRAERDKLLNEKRLIEANPTTAKMASLLKVAAHIPGTYL